MSSPIKNLYKIVVSIQMMIFFVFVVINYDTLQSIPIQININDFFNNVESIDTWNIPTITFYLNLYIILGILLFFVGFSILLSLNVIDTGFNEVGSGLFATFSYYVSFYIILEIPLFYYMGYLGVFGLIIQLIIVLIWFFRGLELLHDKELD